MSGTVIMKCVACKKVHRIPLEKRDPMDHPMCEDCFSPLATVRVEAKRDAQAD